MDDLKHKHVENHFDLAIMMIWYQESEVHVQEQKWIMQHLGRHLQVVQKMGRFSKKVEQSRLLCTSTQSQVVPFSPSLKTKIYLVSFIPPGEYDELLTWLLRGSIAVEILNQLADDRHKCLIFNFKAPIKAMQSNCIRMGHSTGWGLQEFIVQSKLNHDPSFMCQYRKDNTLYTSE